MDKVIFLTHRIPYPPNKGDKIRSFNLLKQLAKRHEVHLGAFVDDRSDWQYENELKSLCAECYLRPLRPSLRKLTSLRGLLAGEPLTLPFYRDRKMAAWVDRKRCEEGVSGAVMFSAAMAQYLLDGRPSALARVVDLVDVDSEKWREYAPRHRWPMNWIYAREASLLLRFERRIAAESDATVLVSAQEAKLFRDLAPESEHKVHSIRNGVDTEYFSPEHALPNPYEPGSLTLVFTGAMDYWANVDAVEWFVEGVFPRIHASVPNARFFIVGARPADQVKRLARIDGVEVTGAVRDVRPYLAHAVAAVAPLRIARGIQNKVLEAMAMAKPVLATPAAMDGIQAPDELAPLVCETPEQFADRAIDLLRKGDLGGLGTVARDAVVRHYGWPESLARLDDLLATVKASGSRENVTRPPVSMRSSIL